VCFTQNSVGQLILGEHMMYDALLNGSRNLSKSLCLGGCFVFSFLFFSPYSSVFGYRPVYSSVNSVQSFMLSSRTSVGELSLASPVGCPS
jgi:hypothetical protein